MSVDTTRGIRLTPVEISAGPVCAPAGEMDPQMANRDTSHTVARAFPAPGENSGCACTAGGPAQASPAEMRLRGRPVPGRGGGGHTLQTEQPERTRPAGSPRDKQLGRGPYLPNRYLRKSGV